MFCVQRDIVQYAYYTVIICSIIQKRPPDPLSQPYSHARDAHEEHPTVHEKRRVHGEQTGSQKPLSSSKQCAQTHLPDRLSVPDLLQCPRFHLLHTAHVHVVTTHTTSKHHSESEVVLCKRHKYRFSSKPSDQLSYNRLLPPHAVCIHSETSAPNSLLQLTQLTPFHKSTRGRLVYLSYLFTNGQNVGFAPPAQSEHIHQVITARVHSARWHTYNSRGGGPPIKHTRIIHTRHFKHENTTQSSHFKHNISGPKSRGSTVGVKTLKQQRQTSFQASSPLLQYHPTAAHSSTLTTFVRDNIRRTSTINQASLVESS